MNQGQGSQATGTRDETYNLVSVLYHSLQGAETCQTYLGDASGDGRLRGFFEQAMTQQRQLADQAKQLLHDRLMQETGGGQGGAFSFNQDGGSSAGGSSGMSGGSDQFASSSGGMSSSGSMGSAGTGRDIGNDPESSQFGQSASGQGQRHTEMTTGGGGTTSF